jgi:uncharacterized protein YutE (UPF0331/DUF86 family)
VDADTVIAERLTLLRNNVDYLKTERDNVHSLQAYAQNTRLKKAVERALHVAVEACLDIARHLIAKEGFRYPQDHQDTFRVLAEEQIISQDLLPPLLDMARFRNLIVHDYAKIDDTRVYGILVKRLGDFDAFAAAVRAYLAGA